MMKPHAFLIMAHGNYKTLGTQLTLLDHPRSTILLHLDKKARLPGDFDPASYVKEGTLIRMPSEPVYWGGESQIRCELSLLKKALTLGDFAFLHLLSGADLPLRPIEEILAFFDAHEGREFVRIEEVPCRPETALRYRYYYPLQELRGTHRVPWLTKGLLALQRLFGIDRTRADTSPRLKGSAYFSITPAFARFLLAKEREILQKYCATFCCDEIFLPTLLRESPFWESRYEENGVPSNLRLVDWERGNPYVFTLEDTEALFSTPCLFARKFSDGDEALLTLFLQRNKKTL